MAMACFRFFTGCLPSFMWRISVRTSCCALGPYLRPLDFLLTVLLLPDFFVPLLREVERLREDELLRALPPDFFDLDFFFVATCTSCRPDAVQIEIAMPSTAHRSQATSRGRAACGK
jgi:hypothetical protein